MKFLACFLVAALSFSAAHANLTVHDFINTKSGLISAGAMPMPVLNNNGIIAFAANTSLYGGRTGLIYGHFGSSGSVYQLAEAVEGAMSTSSFGINDQNDLLWMQVDDYGWRTLATVNVATANNPTFYPATGTNSLASHSLWINNNGVFAYRDTYSLEQRIFDPQTSTLRTFTPPQAMLWDAPTPLNDSGRLIYGTEGSNSLFVYDWDTELTTEIAIPNLTPLAQPALNNEGVVAFFALDGDAGDHALFTLDLDLPASLQRIASIGPNGVFLPTAPIALNESGQILFMDQEGDQLMFWDGTTLETLLSIGDAFEGSTISRLSITAYSLNDRGEVVFGYQLSDNTIGIGYAVVPEPSAFLLVGSASAMLWLLRRRRR